MDDWMIGLFQLYTQLLATIKTALSLISTFHNPLLHSLVWQLILTQEL
jgi:hypothetical protein